MTEHILVVEDQEPVAAFLERLLSDEGYRVSRAKNSLEADQIVTHTTVDVALLDVDLSEQTPLLRDEAKLALLDMQVAPVSPTQEGFELARYLRAGSEDIGIIMLTKFSEADDRVRGLDIGADDYIGKPFDREEIKARIRSLLRRRRSKKAKKAKFSGWVLDFGSHELTRPNGESVELTPKEYELLVILLKQARIAIERRDLCSRLFNRELEAGDRTIDTLVSRIRKKIDTNPDRPSLIQTVRGTGYMFTVDADLVSE